MSLPKTASRRRVAIVLAIGFCYSGSAILAAIAAQHSSSSTSDTSPLLIAEPPTQTLGELAPNTESKVAFLVTNISAENIHLASLRSSCSCIDSSIARAELQPGESTQVFASIKAGSLPGLLRASIDLFYYKNGSNSLLRLPLAVTGQVYALFEPNEVVVFDDTTAGQVTLTDVTIWSGRQPALRIAEVTSTHAAISAGAVSYNLEEQATKIQLKFDRSKSYTSDVKASLLLRVDGPQREVYSIPVSVKSR